MLYYHQQTSQLQLLAVWLFYRKNTWSNTVPNNTIQKNIQIQSAAIHQQSQYINTYN